VSLALTFSRRLSAGDCAWYMLAQLTGGIVGTVIAHLMFGLAPLALSTHGRTGAAQWLSEGVATFGLLAV
ncbi:MAG: aquaporin family protein, partial [Mesorhizobium sp.]